MQFEGGAAGVMDRCLASGVAPFPLHACPLPTSLPWLWLRLRVEEMLDGEVVGAAVVRNVLALRPWSPLFGF
jgi:hypothetical protein